MNCHLSDTTPKARRNYLCYLCGRMILKGEVHVARRGIDIDGPYTCRMHPGCEQETKTWTEFDWEIHDCVDFREELERKKR